MLSILTNVVGPVALIILIGLIWERRKLPLDQDFIASIVVNIGAPCLSFAALADLEMEARAIGEIALAWTVSWALMVLISVALALIFKREMRWYVLGNSFPNLGNLGLPVCLFAFGEQALPLSVVILGLSNFLHFAVGYPLASGTFSLKNVLLSPPLIGAVLGFVVGIMRLEVPLGIMRTTEILGDIAIPLALFSLGAALSRIEFKSAGTGARFGVERIVTGLCTGFATIWLLDLSGLTAGVLLLSSVMPTAVFNYTLTAKFKGPIPQIAGNILVSTPLALATVVVLLHFIRL